MRVRAKVHTSTIRRINDGIRDGMQDVLGDIKQKMRRTGNIPAHYQDRGKWLSVMLGRTGLNPYLESGRLSDSWNQSIEDVRLDERYKTYVITLFDTTQMNEKTKWVGLNYNPENTFKRKNKRQTDRVRGDDSWSHSYLGARGRTAASVVEDGYRPLPNSKGGFSWVKNPYPGFGYWKIYNDGYIGQGINYDPRPFVNRAFSNILGEKASARMFAYNSDLNLSRNMLSSVKKSIVKKIKERE